MGKDFKPTPWYFWFGLLLPGLLVFVCAYYPDIIPYSYLGPIGDYLHYYSYAHPLLPKFHLWFAIILHMGEAIYSWILCREMKMSVEDAILWAAQTLVVGECSVIPLMRIYKRKMMKKTY